MSGLPENLINAIFSDDVLKKKHNSEVLSINNEIAWVVRAKEVREEKTLPFAEAKDAVRQAYIRTEAAKLAENKAKDVLTQLNGGKAVDVKWSEV
ncbi:peptidyl-prolyl cis-trans isomerase, partial [Klebsiella pneumoniae]|nr:peptidyl-prolyl cis-trans isomerase [Klebsiella pneumoniae]